MPQLLLPKSTKKKGKKKGSLVPVFRRKRYGWTYPGVQELIWQMDIINTGTERRCLPHGRRRKKEHQKTLQVNIFDGYAIFDIQNTIVKSVPRQPQHTDSQEKIKDVAQTWKQTDHFYLNKFRLKTLFPIRNTSAIFPLNMYKGLPPILTPIRSTL